MKNKCKICGNPCKSKYCSKECIKERQRLEYRKKHPAYENFYVFYDKNECVKYCGTVEQLVADGTFPTKNALFSAISKINCGKYVNVSVFILRCEKEA